VQRQSPLGEGTLVPRVGMQGSNFRIRDYADTSSRHFSGVVMAPQRPRQASPITGPSLLQPHTGRGGAGCNPDPGPRTEEHHATRRVQVNIPTKATLHGPDFTPKIFTLPVVDFELLVSVLVLARPLEKTLIAFKYSAPHFLPGR
jgi:hypothetical protein